MTDARLDDLLARVPLGWSRVLVDGLPWALSRTTHAEGRSETLWAERLGGSEAFGANVWHTGAGTVLRPCEVPAERVLGLLEALPPRG